MKAAKKLNGVDSMNLARCADCGNQLFRIYTTQAHPAGRRGGIRIACAGCDKTLMEQRGDDPGARV